MVGTAVVKVWTSANHEIKFNRLSWLPYFCISVCFKTSGRVVQMWVSANPGLKFNLLIWLMYFCTSVYFKISKKKTPVDPDKISEEIFRYLWTEVLSGSLL